MKDSYSEAYADAGVSVTAGYEAVERMKKQGVKNGLYSALDVGAVWLQSELGK